MKFSFLLSLLCVTSLAIAEKNPILPKPYETPSVQKPSTLIPWPAGQLPIAPKGYQVEVFAELESPRSIYQLPSGDVMISQARKSPDKNLPSPNKITVFKMKDSKSVSAQTFEGMFNLPFGMALIGNDLFVGEPTQILKFRYENDQIIGPGVKIADLPFPEPMRHWTRHLLAKPDGSKLYVAVGSASNVGEDGDPLDPETAAILEMNPDGSDRKIFANGLRNPVTMAWEPVTGELWTVVNERDELGDGLVPDYLARVQRDGFYGWPYAYWGQNEDPRRAGEHPELVAKSIVPDFSLGAHTASLSLTFTANTLLPAPFNSGALIAQHGSWNSSKLVGYKVTYVPFENGQAVDGELDFLTGFIADDAAGTVYGRPVATAVLEDGSVLVTDDAGGKVWKVSPIPSPLIR